MSYASAAFIACPPMLSTHPASISVVPTCSGIFSTQRRSEAASASLVAGYCWDTPMPKCSAADRAGTLSPDCPTLVFSDSTWYGQALHLQICLALVPLAHPGKHRPKAPEQRHHYRPVIYVPREPEGPAEREMPWQAWTIRAGHNLLQIPAPILQLSRDNSSIVRFQNHSAESQASGMSPYWGGRLRRCR